MLILAKKKSAPQKVFCRPCLEKLILPPSKRCRPGRTAPPPVSYATAYTMQHNKKSLMAQVHKRVLSYHTVVEPL